MEDKRHEREAAAEAARLQNPIFALGVSGDADMSNPLLKYAQNALAIQNLMANIIQAN